MNYEQEVLRLKDMLSMFVQSAYQIEQGNDIWYASFLIDMSKVAREVGNQEIYEFATDRIDEMNEEEELEGDD